MGRRRSRRRRGSRRRSRLRYRFTAAALAFIAITAGGAWLFTSSALNPSSYASLMTSAREHLDARNFSAAAIQLRNALLLRPSDGEARWLLGATYVGLGQGNAAVQELERAKALGYRAQGLDSTVLEAMLLLGQYQEVIGRIAVDPHAAEAPEFLLLLARARLGLHNLEGARETFDEVLDQRPASVRARIGLARIALVQSRVGEADRLLNEAIEQQEKGGDPSLVAPLWLLKGQISLLQESFEAAREAFERVKNSPGTQIDARLGLARVLLANKEPTQALVLIDEVVAHQPRHLEAHYLRALANHESGNREATHAALNTVFSVAPNHPGSIYLASRLAEEEGNYPNAERFLRTLVDFFPDKASLRKRLARVLLAQNDSMGALETLEVLPPDALTGAADALLLGRIYAGAGQPELAFRYLEQASETLASAYRPLALLHLAEGNPALANTVAERFVQNHPETAAAHRLLGRTLLARGAETLAEAAYRRATQVDEFDAAAHYALARFELTRGDDQAARTRLRHSLEHHPDHAPTLVLLARLELEESPAVATQRLEHARTVAPRAVDARVLLGRQYVKSGRLIDAVQVAEEALRVAPEAIAPRLLLGETQRRLGWLANAEETLAGLVATNPALTEAKFQLALARQRQGKLADARTLLNEAIVEQPQHFGAKAALVSLELSARRLDVAGRLARRLIAERPDSPEGYALLGDVALVARQRDSAADRYREALTRGGGVNVLLKLHQVYLRSGAHDQAISVLHDWLTHSPKAGRVTLALAKSYERLGRRDEARATYELMLADYPDSTIAMHALAWLNAEAKPGQALAYAERAFESEPEQPPILHVYGWLLANNGNLELGRRYLERAAERAPEDAAVKQHLAQLPLPTSAPR